MRYFNSDPKNMKTAPCHNMETNSQKFGEYIKKFNEEHTDFKVTTKGPIAKMNGIWYSVNGYRDDIVDVRHELTRIELDTFGAKND